MNKASKLAALLWHIFAEELEDYGRSEFLADTHPSAASRTENARRRLRGKGIDTSIIDSALGQE